MPIFVVRYDVKESFAGLKVRLFSFCFLLLSSSPDLLARSSIVQSFLTLSKPFAFLSRQWPTPPKYPGACIILLFRSQICF